MPNRMMNLTALSLENKPSSSSGSFLAPNESLTDFTSKQLATPFERVLGHPFLPHWALFEFRPSSNNPKQILEVLAYICTVDGIGVQRKKRPTRFQVEPRATRI